MAISEKDCLVIFNNGVYKSYHNTTLSEIQKGSVVSSYSGIATIWQLDTDDLDRPRMIQIWSKYEQETFEELLKEEDKLEKKSPRIITDEVAQAAVTIITSDHSDARLRDHARRILVRYFEQAL